MKSQTCQSSYQIILIYGYLRDVYTVIFLFGYLLPKQLYKLSSDSCLSFTFSFSPMKRYSRHSQSGTQTKYRRVRNRDTEVYESNISNSDLDVEEELKDISTYEEFESAVSRQITSSPVNFLNENSGTQSPEDSDGDEDPLYAGTHMSANKFASNYLQQVTKHNVSDTASDAILKVFRDALPTPNNCPTFYSVKKANRVFDVMTVFFTC